MTPARPQPPARPWGAWLWLVPLLGFVAAWLVLGSMRRGEGRPAPTYSQLIARVERAPASIREVVFDPRTQAVEVTPAKGAAYRVNYPSAESQARFQALLERKGVRFDSKGTGGSAFWGLVAVFAPFLLLIGLWLFLMRRAQGGAGMGQAMGVARSRARRVAADAPRTRFRDVAGADEAVEELGELVEFLARPKRYRALGARIPKGVLLYGPPGTGKTLLARAVAGEAGVPFFHCSGSEFVEMFVGVGASRVRDLFEQAKQAAPAVVFVDEIDALGRQRGAGLGGGHDEREQTLNQLLVEMDGFEANAGVIVVAATNRPDILDPALVRPGRFDRQVAVERPDRAGRRRILAVHAKGKPLAAGVDLDALAAATPGFTGADLANLLNEAALLAARRGEERIGQPELEEAVMRVVAGPEKKARVLSEQERAVIAYHELGHALVGHHLEHTDPIHRVSIVGRGGALGVTVALPDEDRYLQTRPALLHRMAMTLGGRAAEELVFGEPTTGAADDLEKVTDTARQMVTRYGMSERLGPRVLGHERGLPFLGRELGHEPDYSDEVAREIDDEIRRLIDEAHELALASTSASCTASPASCSSARRSTGPSSSGCSPAASPPSSRSRSGLRPRRAGGRRRPPGPSRPSSSLPSREGGRRDRGAAATRLSRLTRA